MLRWSLGNHYFYARRRKKIILQQIIMRNLEIIPYRTTSEEIHSVVAAPEKRTNALFEFYRRSAAICSRDRRCTPAGDHLRPSAAFVTPFARRSWIIQGFRRENARIRAFVGLQVELHRRVSNLPLLPAHGRGIALFSLSLSLSLSLFLREVRRAFCIWMPATWNYPAVCPFFRETSFTISRLGELGEPGGSVSFHGHWLSAYWCVAVRVGEWWRERGHCTYISFRLISTPGPWNFELQLILFEFCARISDKVTLRFFQPSPSILCVLRSFLSTVFDRFIIFSLSTHSWYLPYCTRTFFHSHAILCEMFNGARVPFALLLHWQSVVACFFLMAWLHRIFYIYCYVWTCCFIRHGYIIT